MPAKSRRQQKFIHAQADKGVAWAQRMVAKGHARLEKKRKRKKKKR